jgi:hypothetical protein
MPGLQQYLLHFVRCEAHSEHDLESLRCSPRVTCWCNESEMMWQLVAWCTSAELCAGLQGIVGAGHQESCSRAIPVLVQAPHAWHSGRTARLELSAGAHVLVQFCAISLLECHVQLHSCHSNVAWRVVLKSHFECWLRHSVRQVSLGMRIAITSHHHFAGALCVLRARRRLFAGRPFKLGSHTAYRA